MASVKNLREGQYPSSCKLCESNINIEFKCVDCDLLLCCTCKEKIHTKFKNAKDHRVITIEEIKTYEKKIIHS